MKSDAEREPEPGTEVGKPRNFLSRLGGVYFSPGEAFREIGHSPGVLIPIMALVIVSVLSGLYLANAVDMQSMATAQLEQAVSQGRITEEQMEQQLAIVSRFGGIPTVLFSAISSLLIILAVSGFAKLFSLFVGAENRYRALVSVTAYAIITISIVQFILLFLVLSLKPPGEVNYTNISSLIASNLGILLSIVLGEDALPDFLMRLAGYVDLFAIWGIALLAIGYSAVSQKLKTSTAATWLGLAYGAIAVIGSYIATLIST
jgi:hypothetical protein